MITRAIGPGRAYRTDDHIRCTRCHKLLAERATRPWSIRCVRCGCMNISKAADRTEPETEPEIIRTPLPPDDDGARSPARKSRPRRRTRRV